VNTDRPAYGLLGSCFETLAIGRPWPENRPKHQGTIRTTPTTTAAGLFRTLCTAGYRYTSGLN